MEALGVEVSADTVTSGAEVGVELTGNPQPLPGPQRVLDGKSVDPAERAK